MDEKQDPSESDSFDLKLDFTFLGDLLDRHEKDLITFENKTLSSLENNQTDGVPQSDQVPLEEIDHQRHRSSDPAEGGGRSCLELLRQDSSTPTGSRKRPLISLASEMDGWVATELDEWVGLHPKTCAQGSPRQPPLRYLVDRAEQPEDGERKT